MLTTKKCLFFLTIVYSIYKSVKNQQCHNYTCSEIEQGYCEKSIIDESTGDLLYLLQECPHKFNCPWKDESASIACGKVTPKDDKAYPGGRCQVDFDCLSNNCRNNICQGISAGQRCSANKECIFGLGCIANACTALKSEGVECINEKECLNNLTCLNGKCTSFFSVNDGEIIGKTSSPFLCKSGYAYDGECLNLLNSDLSLLGCDPKASCNYRVTHNNTLISIPDTCECGYNQNKQTYCMRGNLNNTYHDKMVDHIKEILKETSKCNAEEPRPSLCREYLRNDWDLKKRKISYHKDEIYAKNLHKLIDSDYCVPKVVFGWDDTPPQPREGKWSCPIYKCDSVKFDKKTCAYSVNPFNEFGNNMTVYLNNVCQSGELCNFQRDLITGNWTTNHTCVSITRPDLKRQKYPGESCYHHENCIKSNFNSTIGFCINGYCTGLKENDKCESHQDCEAGTFCNGLFCQKQHSERGFCMDQFYCKNSLGCLNSTCTALNSQKNGTYLGKNPDSRLCEYGIVNEKNQCIKISYRKMTPDNHQGFVKCNLGQMCNYTTGQRNTDDELDLFQLPCECGYNSEGQGYCELSHDYRKLFFYQITF
jgi:hypothetical protein